MRKALVIGIDDYPHSPLKGCINDATKMADILRTNGDGSPNFSVELMTSAEENMTRAELRRSISKLFKGESDMALLFFAGHGTVNSSGGFLESVDGGPYDEGVSMDEVLAFANNSPAKNKTIIFDCCHSGAMGNPNVNNNALAQLAEGLTVLAASRASEAAKERDGSGIFTTLVTDALAGGGADIIGNVTPGSIYTFVDQALGPWDQRPIFKSNVSNFTSLRSVPPRVPLESLRKLATYFSTPEEEFKLEPAHEYTHKDAEESKVSIFKELQKFQSVGLVVPVDAEYMYFAAIESKSCALTAAGKQYWRLSKERKI